MDNISDTTPLALLTVGQFVDLINKQLTSLPAPEKVEEKPENINMKEVKELTGYSRDTIYKLVRERKIPCYRHTEAGKLFFKRAEITAWMNNQKVKTIDELLSEKKAKYPSVNNL